MSWRSEIEAKIARGDADWYDNFRGLAALETRVKEVEAKVKTLKTDAGVCTGLEGGLILRTPRARMTIEEVASYNRRAAANAASVSLKEEGIEAEKDVEPAPTPQPGEVWQVYQRKGDRVVTARILRVGRDKVSIMWWLWCNSGNLRVCFSTENISDVDRPANEAEERKFWGRG